MTVIEAAFAAGFNATFGVNRYNFDNAPTDHRSAYRQWLEELVLKHADKLTIVAAPRSDK